MELPVFFQAEQAALAALLGVLLAALYDLLRALRRVLPGAAGFADGLFALVFFLSMLAFALYPGQGVFRLGGMIGIFVGMSQGIVSQLSGNTTVGFAAFALFALILGTAFIMGNVAWANVFGLLLMTLLTLFPLNPCVWAALPARTTLGWTECFLRVMASYLIAVVLFVLVSAIMRKKNQK